MYITGMYNHIICQSNWQGHYWNSSTMNNTVHHNEWKIIQLPWLILLLKFVSIIRKWIIWKKLSEHNVYLHNIVYNDFVHETFGKLREILLHGAIMGWGISTSSHKFIVWSLELHIKCEAEKRVNFSWEHRFGSKRRTWPGHNGLVLNNRKWRNEQLDEWKWKIQCTIAH